MILDDIRLYYRLDTIKSDRIGPEVYLIRASSISILMWTDWFFDWDWSFSLEQRIVGWLLSQLPLLLTVPVNTTSGVAFSATIELELRRKLHHHLGLLESQIIPIFYPMGYGLGPIGTVIRGFVGNCYSHIDNTTGLRVPGNSILDVIDESVVLIQHQSEIQRSKKKKKKLN